MDLENVGLCATGAQLVAETGDELCQVVQLLRVGEVVNTVWQHFGFLAFGHTAYLSATVRLASSMNSSISLLASFDSLK